MTATSPETSTRTFETQDEFTDEVGVSPEIQDWKPVNLASVRLKELRDELASLNPEEAKRRARDFVESQQTNQSAPNGVNPEVAATAAGVGVALSGAVRDAVQDATKPENIR